MNVSIFSVLVTLRYQHSQVKSKFPHTLLERSDWEMHRHNCNATLKVPTNAGSILSFSEHP